MAGDVGEVLARLLANPLYRDALAMAPEADRPVISAFVEAVARDVDAAIGPLVAAVRLLSGSTVTHDG